MRIRSEFIGIFLLICAGVLMLNISSPLPKEASSQQIAVTEGASTGVETNDIKNEVWQHISPTPNETVL